MKVISPLDGGGQEVILTLIQGGCNFILRPTLLILEPPPPDNYWTVPNTAGDRGCGSSVSDGSGKGGTDFGSI